MISQTINLPEKFSNYLLQLPENGMGYQFVKVVLKSGKILRNLKVFNSSVLVVDATPPVSIDDIEKVELEKSKPQ